MRSLEFSSILYSDLRFTKYLLFVISFDQHASPESEDSISILLERLLRLMLRLSEVTQVFRNCLLTEELRFCSPSFLGTT